MVILVVAYFLMGFATALACIYFDPGEYHDTPVVVAIGLFFWPLVWLYYVITGLGHTLEGVRQAGIKRQERKP